MGGVSWVFVGLAVAVAVVALLVVAVSALRGPAAGQGTDRGRGSEGRAGGGSTAPRLVRGFGYLTVPALGAPRRAGVQVRLERACRRVDAVDPHEGARRIGEALLVAGVVRPGRPVDGWAPGRGPAGEWR